MNKFFFTDILFKKIYYNLKKNKYILVNISYNKDLYNPQMRFDFFLKYIK